jgi:cytidylate kinase
MLVAIDGPVGAGKSTVARAVAVHLGFTYLDTGAMYRCVALARVQDEAAAYTRPVEELAIDFEGERVFLDDMDATDAIRTPAVSQRASEVATDAAVRENLVERQRALTRRGDWVAEGRDIGTVVCPDAHVKVFLTASPEVRAQRRAEELGVDYERVLAEQSERDERDERRAHSPLIAANDAVPVDTSELDLDAVIEQIETLVVEAREIDS